MPKPILTARLGPADETRFRCVIVAEIANPSYAGTVVVDNDIAEALAKHITAFALPAEVQPPDVCSKPSTPSKYKGAFCADVDGPRGDRQYIEVNEWPDLYTCGKLCVPSEHAAALCAWIEAFPSLIEAANVKVPKR